MKQNNRKSFVGGDSKEGNEANSQQMANRQKHQIDKDEKQGNESE
jgi:hypothetical protein